MLRGPFAQKTTQGYNRFTLATTIRMRTTPTHGFKIA